MARFSSLFRRFLSEEGPSVDWEKIQKLPEDAVRDYATLSLPKEDQVSRWARVEGKTKYHFSFYYISDSRNAGQISCHQIEWWFRYIDGLPWTKKCYPS